MVAQPVHFPSSPIWTTISANPDEGNAMSERRWSKAIFGGLVGLVLGVFVGEHRAAEVAREAGAAVPTGLNPMPYMHERFFWIPLIFCVVVFAFIVGRIGRPTSQSDL